MDRRRNHRLNRRHRRLFLPLILSLDPYPGMPWHLYHYAMALWHLRHGARYRGQRLLKGCSVEKKKGLCNLSLCWITLRCCRGDSQGALCIV